MRVCGWQDDSDDEEAERSPPPVDKGAGGDKVTPVTLSPPKQEKEPEVKEEEEEEEEPPMTEEERTLQMVGGWQHTSIISLLQYCSLGSIHYMEYIVYGCKTWLFLFTSFWSIADGLKRPTFDKLFQSKQASEKYNTILLFSPNPFKSLCTACMISLLFNFGCLITKHGRNNSCRSFIYYFNFFFI